MALTENGNSNGMIMPVAPMYGGFGMGGAMMGAGMATAANPVFIRTWDIAPTMATVAAVCAAGVPMRRDAMRTADIPVSPAGAILAKMHVKAWLPICVS